MNNRYIKNEDGSVTLLDDIELRHWDLTLAPLKEKGIVDVKIPVSKVMWLEGDLPEGAQPKPRRQATQKDIATIKLIIEKEFRNFEGMSDIEKVVAVDSFLQREIQYIGCSETIVNGVKYRSDDHRIDEFNRITNPSIKTSGQPITYHSQLLGPLTGGELQKNRGVCDDFAYLPTLLLNNPVANIACYNQGGTGHNMTNIVLDNEIYCLDITQNVCAGKHRFQTAQQPYGVFQSSAYNYGATLQTAEGLDIGDDLRVYNEYDRPRPNGVVMPRGCSKRGEWDWWKAEKNRIDAIKHSADPMSAGVGIDEDYMALTSKYQHATNPIPREQIETAVESLKQKGFRHLFEYPKQPYYRQIAEPLKLSEVHKDADQERL